MASAWSSLNDGPEIIDLVAIGSPHASLDECRALAGAFDGGKVQERVDVIVTAGRDVLAEARKDGVLTRLEASGVRVLPDVCWCSISEPIFPEPSADANDQFGQVRSLRTGSLRPVRAVWQPC